MKLLMTLCPLCQCGVALGPADQPRDAMREQEAAVAHLQQHTVAEWVACVQDLRTQLTFRDELRSVPYWAMPRA